MSASQRRQNVMNAMEPNSYLVLFSGKRVHISVDSYYPFEVNKQFFYLTGLERENLVLVLDNHEPGKEVLFIPRVNPLEEKWNGKQLTVDKAKEITGISTILYVDAVENYLHTIFSQEGAAVYFDTYLHMPNDLPDYNMVQARAYQEKYPQIEVKNIFPIVANLRFAKDEEEVSKVQHAVDITNKGLQYVMSTLKPGMYENQVQANFEYMIRYEGASGPSFTTIAGSGYNGTMLHYHENCCECKDGDLILLDLGAKAEGYCADITRTYPINGKFTPRQKEIYDLVLKANRTIVEKARPGMTTGDLNDICKEVLATGLKEMGLIKEDKELVRYYMHGVSHSIGIDVHDATISRAEPLRAGSIISDEPGLYIEEESIGIRIEDDLLITEDGCRVLSADIIRTTEEIEEFMAKNHQ